MCVRSTAACVTLYELVVNYRSSITFEHRQIPPAPRLTNPFFAPADGEEGGEGGWWDLSSPGSLKCKGPSGP